MKYSLIFILILVACQNGPVSKKVENLFSYESNDKDFKQDTFSIDKILQPYVKDTMIFKYDFNYKNKQHSISMYSNFLSFPCGPGKLTYNLDSVGVIYVQYSHWDRIQQLKCSNDSINEIIKFAVKKIKEHPKLKSFNPFNEGTVPKTPL